MIKHESQYGQVLGIGIRKANIGLENLDKMVDATQEEKDIIAGQLYFFRAWFHLQINYLLGRYALY